MLTWLVKTEPGDYSIDDLARERVTVWDGVRNPTALRHMRAMQAGDRVLIYHSGKERAVVGLGRVEQAAYSAPDGSTVVDIAYVDRLQRPVSLAVIKGEQEFAGWELVRLPRLSVMPVPDDAWSFVASR
jgi:predicted RNA-binding protein with PUA-like domain